MPTATVRSIADLRREDGQGGEGMENYAKRLSRACAPKKPGSTNPSPHVGVEIECFHRARESWFVSKLVKAAALDWVQMKEDSSIEDFEDNEFEANEFAILGTEANIEKRLRLFCSILRQADASTNKSCGLHVHIDVRDAVRPGRDPQVIANKLIAALPLLKAMTPRRRHGGGRGDGFSVLNKFKYKGEPEDRYTAINTCAISEHGSVEVRLHNGTVIESMIVNWVKLLLRIVHSPELTPMPKKLPALFEALKIKDPDMKAYVKARIKKFTKEPHPFIGRVPDDQVPETDPDDEDKPVVAPRIIPPPFVPPARTASPWHPVNELTWDGRCMDCGGFH